MYEIHHKECLEHMHSMPAQSVDAILTDLPYGTTACAWDVVIPFEPMWEAVKHVLKPDGAFVTTASQPFTSLLVCSNLQWFRYEWVWNKVCATGHLNADRFPMKKHENIIVFSLLLPTYNKQMQPRDKGAHSLGNVSNYTKDRGVSKSELFGILKSKKQNAVENYLIKNPDSILKFSRGNGHSRKGCHPTQKPVALYKYLVQTYTNPGDTVLDMCMGSGTTGEACIETGRDFIGIEQEKEHFVTAQERLDRVSRQGQLFMAASSANKVLQTTPKDAGQKLLFNV